MSADPLVDTFRAGFFAYATVALIGSDASGDALHCAADAGTEAASHCPARDA